MQSQIAPFFIATLISFIVFRFFIIKDKYTFKNDDKPSQYIKLPEQKEPIPFYEGRWLPDPVSLLKTILSLILAIIAGVLVASLF